MNNFLLLIAGLVIVIFAAAFAVPYFVDWNDYRTQIEEQTSLIIGRQVRIDGDVNLRLLPRPYVKFKNVRVLDSFPGARKPFVKADKFKLWLSAPSLLSGNLEARKIELIRPVVNFVVDARGRGNWEDFRGRGKQDAWLNISNIALQHVSVKQGRIAFHSLVEQGNQIFETPPLSGKLSAHSLEGPYKFNGHLRGKAGEGSTVQFSTGRSSDKAGMPVKAFLQNRSTKASYRLESRVRSEGGKLSYKGKISASVPFDRLFMSRAERLEARSRSREEPLEIKADLEGSATQARLGNILFSLVRKNRPQGMKGDVLLDWSRGELQAVGNFSSRLVDADFMGSNMGKKLDIANILASLPTHVYGLGQLFHKADFSLKLDQVQVGGQTVQNLGASLSKTHKDLKISSLSAKLPGSGYLSLSGDLVRDSTHNATFSGPLLIQGQNLGQLKSWMEASGEPGTSLHKPFIFAAEVIAGKGEVRLANIEADLGGNLLRGELVKKSGDGTGLDVRLRITAMEGTQLFGKKMSLKALVDHFSGRKETAAGSGRIVQQEPLRILGLSLQEMRKKQARLSLLLGQLKLSDTVLNDCHVRVEFTGADDRLEQLSFMTAEGLKIRVDGTFAPGQPRPGQRLNIRAQGLKPSAITQFATIFSLPETFVQNRKRLALLHPVDLNIGMTAGKKGKGSRFLVNGQAGGSELFAYGHTAMRNVVSGTGSFDRQALDMKVSVRNPDGTSLLRQVLTELAAENLAGMQKGEGSLDIRLVGIPAKGLQTEFYGKMPGLELSAIGQVRVDAGGKTQFVGPVSLQAGNMSRGLALLDLGIQTRAGAGGLAIKGRLAKNGELYSLAGMTGKIGGSDIYGSAQIDRTGERPVFNLSLTSQTARLASILEPGIDWFRKGRTGVQSGEENGYWTGKRFDLALLKKFSGTLELKSKELEIDRGLVVRDATLKAVYGDGQLAVTGLDGTVFGGKLQSNFILVHGRTVSSVSGKVAIGNADLEQFFPEQANALATGRANLELAYDGRGLSPRGLVSLLKGKGRLEIMDTQFNYLAPSALRALAKEEIERDGAPDTTFAQRFSRHLSAGQFEAGTKSFAISLQDGIASFKQLKLSDEGTGLEIWANVSLSAMSVDSNWKMAPEKGSGQDELPPATLQFSGKLASLGEIQPVYKLKSLQRFLSVLKIETDVRRLEDINRQLPKALPKPVADAENPLLPGNERVSGRDGGEGVRVSPLENLPPLQPSGGITIEPLNELSPAG